MDTVADPRPLTPTVVWLRYVKRRYERDVALMTGHIAPVADDLDDVAIMDHFASSGDGQAIISDRKLRIKTLEAMIDLLEETSGQPVSPGSGAIS